MMMRQRELLLRQPPPARSSACRLGMALALALLLLPSAVGSRFVLLRRRQWQRRQLFRGRGARRSGRRAQRGAMSVLALGGRGPRRRLRHRCGGAPRQLSAADRWMAMAQRRRRRRGGVDVLVQQA